MAMLGVSLVLAARRGACVVLRLTTTDFYSYEVVHTLQVHDFAKRVDVTSTVQFSTVYPGRTNSVIRRTSSYALCPITHSRSQSLKTKGMFRPSPCRAAHPPSRGTNNASPRTTERICVACIVRVPNREGLR